MFAQVPLLATYGSLMRAFGQHRRLGIDDRLAFVSPCEWQGDLYDLGRFPGAVPGEGIIHGELFRLRDSDVWTVLDRYEGYDPDHEESSLFVRRRVSLLQPDGQSAWVYWYAGNPPESAHIPSGDWATYLQDA